MIHVRIDRNVKTRAAETLAEMGLTVSGAVRLLLTRSAAEKALPFDLRVPNQQTRDAIAELEEGNGKRFASVADLMADLRSCSRMGRSRSGFAIMS